MSYAQVLVPGMGAYISGVYSCIPQVVLFALACHLLLTQCATTTYSFEPLLTADLHHQMLPQCPPPPDLYSGLQSPRLPCCVGLLLSLLCVPHWFIRGPAVLAACVVDLLRACVDAAVELRVLR